MPKPTIKPAVTIPSTVLQPAPKKTKPGNILMGIGCFIGVLGVFVLIVSSNTTDQYGQHHGPTSATLLIFAVALAFVVVGFARRLLAAIERNH